MSGKVSGLRQAIQDAVLAVLPIALVYFSGWAYLSNYLGGFGIDATAVNIPIDTVLVYAFRPLYSWQIIGLLSFFSASASAVRYSRFARRVWIKLDLFFVAIALIVALVTINYTSTVKSDALIESVWNGDRPRTTATAESPADHIDDYKVCATDRRLSKVIELPDRVYVLCRSEIQPCDRGILFLVGNDGRLISRTLLRRSEDLKGDCHA
jgi:hypothetical protein